MPVRTPPVVIQTSALDCGPASLSSLLRGLGAPGAYEALRDVCSTDVDGTSIDALEVVAAAAGTDAEQLVLPAEHVLAMHDDYLPAIAVIRLPDGFPHFVVAWRKTRRHVIVMDPAVGLRRLPHKTFLNMLYRHSTEVPADAWREWAGSPVFVTALDRRLGALGVKAGQRAALIARAEDDPNPRGFALLDAAMRSVERGGPADRLAGLDEAEWETDRDEYSCMPTDDPETVTLRGAVIVRAARFDAEKGDADLVERLSTTEPTPARIAASLLRRPRLWLSQVVVAAIAIAVVTLTKNGMLQPLVSGDVAHRLRPSQVAVICATVIAGIVGYAVAYLAGRQLEQRIRAAWWSLVSRLPDAFTRTRPSSDITERGHLLHRVRELPLYLLRSFLSLSMVLGAAVAITVVAPAGAPFALLLAAVTIGVPAATYRWVTDADFQTRTISGALARFSYDALLGAEAVAAASAQAAIRHEQCAQLRAWQRAQTRFITLTTSIRIATGVAGGALAAACVSRAHIGAAGGLLVAVLAVLAVDSGAVITDTLRAIAEARSSIARAAGPLGTRTIAAAGTAIAEPAELRLSNVTVRLGAATILDDISLTIPAGQKIAVLGSSGSGKSSLVATLMGWLEPTAGAVLWGGEPVNGAALRRAVAWSAPETRLWNDGIGANVAYGRTADADDALDRLRVAEADSLPDRLAVRGDTRLGDGGSGLSDGEAQRVRFARTLGRPGAALVVLDEPFRGLERDRRGRLLKAVMSTWPHATVVCVLHDIADALTFDRVVVMSGGTVVEDGAPAELAAHAGSRLVEFAAAEIDDRLLGYRRLDLDEVPS